MRLGLDPSNCGCATTPTSTPSRGSLVQQGFAGVLRARRRALRLERREPGAALTPRGHWLIGTGHGDGGVPGAAVPRLGPASPRAAVRRRDRGRPGRDAGVRHRGRHGDDPGRRGRSRRAVWTACRFEDGDTDLPNITAAVGSAGAGMISAAVHSAATALREQLVARAVADAGSPLHGADPGRRDRAGRRMTRRRRTRRRRDYTDLMQRNFLSDAEASGSGARRRRTPATH